MHRILSVAVGAIVVFATVHVSAQQALPARAPGAAFRAPVTRAAPATVQAPSLSPRLLPGTRPNVLTTIQGNALSSTNGGLPDAMLRLRNARSGRIVSSQVTDKSGLFAFTGVEPGTYVIEIMSGDQAVLAASEMLTVNAGETISAIVKLPFRIPPVAGLFWNTPTALAVAIAAGTAQVLTIRATTDASPGGN